MKCLVIVESSIRKLLFATPVLRCLKQQVQASVIYIIVKESYQDILAHHSYIDVTYSYKNSIQELTPLLKEEKFDWIIDLQNDYDSKAWRSALKMPVLAAPRHTFQKFVFTNLKWNVMPSCHVVDQYFKSISSLKIKNDGKGLDFFISAREEIKQTDIPASHHAGYIALAIGKTPPTNKLPLQKVQELCKEIQHPIIIIGDKLDYADGNTIAQVDPIKLYNACGKFSLQENADLIRKSRLVITYDGDYMHMAAALKKPVITIWGSTTPSLGAYVYYGENYPTIKSDNIQVHQLWCRPCTTVGREQCPLGHFKCMKNIDIGELVTKVNLHLGRN